MIRSGKERKYRRRIRHKYLEKQKNIFKSLDFLWEDAVKDYEFSIKTTDSG